jgi:hypothetical protein
MFIVFTVCFLFIMTLLSVNSKELFEVAATAFTADIVAKQHILAHPVKDPCPPLDSFTH